MHGVITLRKPCTHAFNCLCPTRWHIIRYMLITNVFCKASLTRQQMIDVRGNNTSDTFVRYLLSVSAVIKNPLFRFGAPVLTNIPFTPCSRRVFISCLTMVVHPREAYTFESRKEGDVCNNLWQGNQPAGDDPEFNHCCPGPQVFKR